MCDNLFMRIARSEAFQRPAPSDVYVATPSMPPPTETTASAPRKRGRPPKTPTKGPEQKQRRAASPKQPPLSGVLDLSTHGSTAPLDKHPAALGLYSALAKSLSC
jgi:hypothetical protein